MAVFDFQTDCFHLCACFMSLLLILEAVPSSYRLSPATCWTKAKELHYKNFHLLVKKLRRSMFSILFIKNKLCEKTRDIQWIHLLNKFHLCHSLMYFLPLCHRHGCMVRTGCLNPKCPRTSILWAEKIFHASWFASVLCSPLNVSFRFSSSAFHECFKV